MKTLAQAREERLDREIDKMISDKVSLAVGKTATPTAKVKLRGVLKKYAGVDQPFQACVKDNMAKFGPGRAEAVCAALKGPVKVTKSMIKSGVKASEVDAVIDGDVLLALDAITDVDLAEIFLGMRALEEHNTIEAVPLLDVKGEAELQRWGVGQVQLAELEKSS